MGFLSIFIPCPNFRMRRAFWLLAALITSATSNEIIDVNLIFPQNETYKPTDIFPVVFAFQNPDRARHITFTINYDLQSWDGNNQGHELSRIHDLRGANWSSSDPFLVHDYFSTRDIPGKWGLRWSLNWESCDEEEFENPSMHAEINFNKTSFLTHFTVEEPGATENGSEPLDIDLVAATSETSCPDPWLDTGLGINVTDRIMDASFLMDWDNGRFTNWTCAVIEPTPTVPDPCQVTINRTVAQSMQASFASARCRSIPRPDDCPEEDNSALKGAEGVLGVSGLVVLGALGIFVM